MDTIIQPKTATQSKMVLFNIFVTLQGWLPSVADLIQSKPVDSTALWYGIVNSAIGLVNIILRVWFTKRPIE